MAGWALPALLLPLLLAAGSEATISVFSSKLSIIALRHSTVVLPCTFTVTPGPIDPKGLTVIWYQYGYPVAKFENEDSTVRQEASLFEKDIRGGNASLLLESIVKRDEGQYECEVTYGGEKASASLVLTIQVPPEVLLSPASVQLLHEHTVTCSARSFYPQLIHFSWKRNGRSVDPLGTTEPQLNSDGTLNMESSYHFTPKSRDDLTCEVTHEALKEPLRRSVTYVGLTSAEVGLIMAAVIAFFLLLLTLFWFLSVSLSPLVPLKLVQDEPTSIQSTVKGWRLRLVTLQWLINDVRLAWHSLDRQQTDCEVDNMPLVDPSGHTSTKGQSAGGLLLVETPIALHFTPKRGEHQGAELKCRATHRLTRRSVERVVRLEQVCVRPQLSDIENVSQDSDSDVRLQIRAEEFYPEDISFTWALGEDGVSSQLLDITKTNNGNFSTGSICSIPLSQLQSPGFKISVVTEHRSMGRVEKTATGDTPGIDGRPQLSDIEMLSFSRAGHPCTLSCTISKFFPSGLNVTWLREEGETGHWSVTTGAKTWGAKVCTSKPEQKNNTYEMTSTVEFTPTSHEMEQMTYVCRVEHVTLNMPVEKDIKLTSAAEKMRLIVSDVQVVFTCLGEPCLLTCTVSNFSPKEITVMWLRRQKDTKEVLLAGSGKWNPIVTHFGPAMRSSRYSLVSQAEFTPLFLGDLEDMEYICRVNHQSLGDKAIEKSCSVSAVMQHHPIMSEIRVKDFKALGQPCTLSCSIQDFYPKDIKVTWQQAGGMGRDITGVTSEPQWGKRSYQLESVATFIPKALSDLEDMEFICKVEHKTLNKKGIERCSGKLVIPGLLHPPVMSDIQVLRWDGLGQPCTLNCCIKDFFPKEIEVTWHRRDKKMGREVTAGTDEWKAQVKTSHPKVENVSYRLDSQVTFTPQSLSDVDEVDYVCKVKHKNLEETSMEKTSGESLPTALCHPPSVSDIEVAKVTSNDNFYTLSCSILDFYPKLIKVTWLQRSLKTSGKVSEENAGWETTVDPPSPDMKGNGYKVQSRLTFHLDSLIQLEDMEFICRVEHECLSGPLEKHSGRIIIPDLVSEPLVSDVEAEFTEFGQLCTLKCTVSAFYPKDITVTWERKCRAEKKKRRPSAAELNHLSVTQDGPSLNNIRYWVVSKAGFTPQTLSDLEDMEYICKVEHETLKGKTIEKSWPRVREPRISDIVVHFAGLNQLCTFSLTASDFFPKEMIITWDRKHSSKLKRFLKQKWNPRVKQDEPSWNDLRFSLRSTAEFTPTALSDLEDMEFICKVEHETVKGKAIERSCSISPESLRPSPRDAR
uniref:Uncharacterized LOC114661610 n=1 Tax=Erpetoichthys calabaricus TaxID=27687 RepID=A0A8C4SRV5_ERPCA